MYILLFPFQPSISILILDSQKPFHFLSTLSGFLFVNSSQKCSLELSSPSGTLHTLLFALFTHHYSLSTGYFHSNSYLAFIYVCILKSLSHQRECDVYKATIIWLLQNPTAQQPPGKMPSKQHSLPFWLARGNETITSKYTSPCFKSSHAQL